MLHQLYNLLQYVSAPSISLLASSEHWQKRASCNYGTNRAFSLQTSSAIGPSLSQWLLLQYPPLVLWHNIQTLPLQQLRP